MTENANVLTNLCLAIYSRFASETSAVEIKNLAVIGDHAIGGVGPVVSESVSSHNDFYTSVNGQLFEDDAPEYAVYPYAVYNIQEANYFYTFTEDYTNAGIKLVIYSDNMNSFEIKQIYRYAGDLFDEYELIVTGSNLVWLREKTVMFGIEQHVTPVGTKKVLAYTIDFEVLTSLN